jgi:hypothetical protein
MIDIILNYVFDILNTLYPQISGGLAGLLMRRTRNLIISGRVGSNHGKGKPML